MSVRWGQEGRSGFATPIHGGRPRPSLRSCANGLAVARQTPGAAGVLAALLRTYVHAAAPKTYRPIPPHNRLPLATLMSTKLSRPLWAILRVSAPCRAPHGLAQSRRPSLWLSAGQAKIQAPPASRPLWPSGPGKAMPQHPAAIHQPEAALGPPQSRSQQHQA